MDQQAVNAIYKALQFAYHRDEITDSEYLSAEDVLEENGLTPTWYKDKN